MKKHPALLFKRLGGRRSRWPLNGGFHVKKSAGGALESIIDKSIIARKGVVISHDRLVASQESCFSCLSRFDVVKLSRMKQSGNRVSGKVRFMRKRIMIMTAERDGDDGLIVTFPDGTTAGYVVEELLVLRPRRERTEIKERSRLPVDEGEIAVVGPFCNLDRSGRVVNPEVIRDWL